MPPARWPRLARADQRDADHPVVMRDPCVAVDDAAVRIPDGPGDRHVLAVDRVLDALALARWQRGRLLDGVEAAHDVGDRGRLQVTVRPFGTLQISKRDDAAAWHGS